MVYRGLSCGIAGSREPQLHTSGVHDFFLFYLDCSSDFAQHFISITDTDRKIWIFVEKKMKIKSST